MKYFKKIEGPNLYLSPVNPEDAETYTRWINDLSMSVSIGSANALYSLPREKAVLEGMAKEGHNYAIVLQENDELLGNCSLFSIDMVQRTAEIGIFIGERNHRSKGYGAEALQLLSEYGFKILNLNNIMLRVFEFNHSARKCYEKAGYRIFGRRSKSYYVNGAYYDQLFMELLPSDLKSNYLDAFLPPKP